MHWSEYREKISLADRPRILQMGFANHGRIREERYHLTCWTLHAYYYKGNIRVNGTDFPIRFGHIGVNPPNAETLYRFDETHCRHLWAHFEARASGNRPPTRLLPIMKETKTDFDGFNLTMEEMLRCYASERLRAEVLLWGLLFRLAESAEKSLGKAEYHHPALTSALEYIEKNLSRYLPTVNVLEAANLSHNHLNRLFKTSMDKTIREYILERRMEKAAYFLRSTRMPVKNVAMECGLPDIQHFNKTIRKYFGIAPTQLRLKVMQKM